MSAEDPASPDESSFHFSTQRIDDAAGARPPSVGQVLGRYQLDRCVGRGGMGVVWKARDKSLDRDVALKFLPRALASDEAALRRLQREANALLELTHDAIVRLLTIERAEGSAFLVMEFIAGPDLAMFLADRADSGLRGLNPDEVLWVLEQVVPALEHAHARGWTHRDLKPANLMLTAPVNGALHRSSAKIKLTDFGIAFSAAATLTQKTGEQPSGTYPFISPEVLMGEMPTPLSDVYGLGATVFALVRGEPPFTHGDVARQVLERAPAPLQSGRAGLDRAVARALEKRPGDRPQSVSEFLEIARCVSPAELTKRAGLGAAGRAHRRRWPAFLVATPAIVVCAVWLGMGAIESARSPDSSDLDHGNSLPAHGGVAAGPPSAAHDDATQDSSPIDSAGAELGTPKRPTDDSRGTAEIEPIPTAAAELEAPASTASDAEAPTIVPQAAVLRPSINLIEPAWEGPGPFYWNKEFLPLSATTENLSGSSLTVKQGDRTAHLGLNSEGGFATSLPLQADRNVIRFVAEDGTELRQLEIVRDIEPPTLALLDPPPGVPINAIAVDVVIAVTDANLVSLRMGERILEHVDGNRWRAGAVSLENEGENAFTVVADDAARNSSTLELHIVRDRNGPLLQQAQPAAGSVIVKSDQDTLTLSFSEALKSASVGGIPAEVSGTRCMVATKLLDTHSAPAPFRWEVSDLAGNESQGTVVFSFFDDLRISDGWKPVSRQAGFGGWCKMVSDPRTGLEFVLLELGEFMSPGQFLGAPPLRIEAPAYLARTEVTVEMWSKFATETHFRTVAESAGGGWVYHKAKLFGGVKWNWEPSQNSRANWKCPIPGVDSNPDRRSPVRQVAFADVQAFCKHYGYRLPSVDEWNSCSGAPCQRTENVLDESWYDEVGIDIGWRERRDGYPFASPVASFQSHENGLFDICGNVREWCTGSSRAGDNSSSTFGVRGGSYRASRVGLGIWSALTPVEGMEAVEDIGFRVAFSPGE